MRVNLGVLFRQRFFKPGGGGNSHTGPTRGLFRGRPAVPGEDKQPPDFFLFTLKNEFGKVPLLFKAGGTGKILEGGRPHAGGGKNWLDLWNSGVVSVFIRDPGPNPSRVIGKAVKCQIRWQKKLAGGGGTQFSLLMTV